MLFSFSKPYKPVILLVDDNIFIKKLLTKILEARYTVYTASNGIEAMVLLHQSVKPDLIITDIEMPVMNGYELIKAISQIGLYKHIPVCILSDHHTNMIKNELGSIEVEEVFSKPFDPHTFLDKINKRVSKLQELYSISN
jgi:two-component system chemotaxis response regulator CheY